MAEAGSQTNSPHLRDSNTHVATTAEEPHHARPDDSQPWLSASQNHVTDAPPFWQRHGRTESSVSYHSVHHLKPAPILLEDHSEEQHEQSRACWARSVTVDEYVVVSGPTGIGAYIVWHCTVSTLKGGDLVIRKR